MRAFDWVRFLNENGIPYVTSGKNVKRGEVNIKCPFCGDADPSQHFGFSPDSGNYSCWRMAAHAGRKPHRVIMALLGCSYAVADEIVRSDADAYSGVSMEALKERISAQRAKRAKAPRERLEFPAGVRKFDLRTTSIIQRPFLSYLVRRGFTQDEAWEVVHQYGLRWAQTGSQAGRLVFPMLHSRRLQGWSGRAIGPAKIKYHTEPADGPYSRELMFNKDGAAEGGRALVVVEGPVDVLKVDYHGKDRGVRAVGVLTTSVTPEKAEAILKLAERFDTLHILLDAGAQVQAMRMRDVLAPGHPRIERLPEGYDDPGDLSGMHARRLARDLIAP